MSRESYQVREAMGAEIRPFFFLGLKTDFESRCHGGPGDKHGPLIGRNLPEVVNKIVWVRQLVHKVTESHTVQ